MSTTATLPTLGEIQKAFESDEKGGRQLICQALQYGLVSNDNTSKVILLLQELFRSPPVENLEEHLVDALWLVSSSSLVVVDDKNTTSAGPRDAVVRILQEFCGTGSSYDDGAKAKEEQQSDATTKTKLRSLVVQLQSHLDPSLLEQAGLIASEKDLTKKLRMLNTKQYRQHKFNLLQEESEGFSKALTSLVQGEHATLKSIMGTFHVDPNRILDLALDVLIEEQGKNPTSTKRNLDWMKDYSTDKIPALMAFKLKNSADSAPDTLKILQAIASLAIHEPTVLPLDKMSNYLAPVTELLAKTMPTFMQMERSRVSKVGRVSLGGSSAARQKEAEREAKLHAQLLSYRKQLEKMHRLQLLDILLEQRQWKLAQVLFPNTDELKQVMQLYKELGLAVCDWIQEQLTPLFNRYCPIPDGLVGLESNGSGQSKDKVSSDDVLGSMAAEQVVEMVAAPLACIMDSGCVVGRPALFCQLCRLLGALLKKERPTDVKEISPSPALYAFIESFVLPSLSLFPPNPTLPMEVWSILELFPYTTRYQLYRDWRGVGLEKAGLQLFGDKKKPLVVVESEMNAGKDARYVLKRLSKESIRESCRQVAKVTHSSPLVMFTTVLSQIESYDNLVSMMVEALRFVSPLGKDVLGFCMLSRLCGSSNSEGDRSRSKEGGINSALWLQSMESFIGAFYEKHPTVEFRGIVCYVMRRLRDGHVTELGVLSSLLKTTGGWQFQDYSPAASLSSAQLEGRAGTTLLKRETMTFGVVDSFNLRSSQQLRFVLQSEDMGVSLLILLAQVRSRIVFDDGGGRPKPVKLIGSLVDATQAVLSTLLDFLTTSSTLAQPVPSKKGSNGNKMDVDEEYKLSKEIETFATSMPGLVELITTYGIDMATAWMLCRPLVRAAERTESNGSVKDVFGAFSLTDKVRNAYKPLVHSKTCWDNISPEFFEMFFLHTLYDLFCPEAMYAAEANRATKEVERLTQRQSQGGAQLSLQPGSVGGGSQQNTDAEIERLKLVAAALTEQVNDHQARVEAVHQKIKDTAKTFFPKKEVSVSAVNAFLSQCIFPRCMQGPDGAMYCAHFVKLLHQGGTPGFSTLHYLDELFAVMSSSLFGVTEGEAANMSILLLETWKDVSRWRYDEKIFQEEVSGKPGSFMVNPAEEGNAACEETIYSVSFEQYKALFVKWQTSIGAAALGCLKSSEYMHTRASLIVLSRIVEVFPSRPNIGNKLFEVLEPLKSEQNNLPDIRSAAQAYFMQLTKARADGVWKEEDAAVVKARLKKEKEAQDLRKRKAAERFNDMKVESEKISADMGGGGGDRFRDRDRRSRPSDGGRDHGRGGLRDDRRSQNSVAVAPKFEPPPRVGDRREHGRGLLDRQPEPRIPQLGSLGRAETHTTPTPRIGGVREPLVRGVRVGVDDRGKLEGRWEDSRVGGRGKRNRSPTPDENRGGGRGSRDAKRARTDLEPRRSPGRSGGGRRSRR